MSEVCGTRCISPAALRCCCSVQYMQQPERVFAEVYRVLKPGGVFILTFSNRMFYDKVRGNPCSRIDEEFLFLCCSHSCRPVHVRGDKQLQPPVQCHSCGSVVLAVCQRHTKVTVFQCWRCSCSSWCGIHTSILVQPPKPAIWRGLQLITRQICKCHSALQAIAAWRDGTGYGRCQLVKQYFQAVQGYTEPEVVMQVALPAAQQQGGALAQLLPKQLQQFFARASNDPFYAVLAYRNFKPDYS